MGLTSLQSGDGPRRIKVKLPWVVFSILAVAAAALVAHRATRGPRPEIKLADGTQFTLIEVVSGRTNLHFQSGTDWRWACYRLLRLSSPFETETFSTIYTNGAIGFVMRRHSQEGMLTNAWNGCGQLSVLRDPDAPLVAHRFCVSFRTKSKDGKTVVNAEDILYEVPASREEKLHLRVVETNQTTGEITIHTLLVPNPLK